MSAKEKEAAVEQPGKVMAYRIGICDDEQNIVLTLTGYIEHYFQLQGDDVEIHTWNSGEELISDKVFGTGEGVDIL